MTRFRFPHGKFIPAARPLFLFAAASGLLLASGCARNDNSAQQGTSSPQAVSSAPATPAASAEGAPATPEPAPTRTPAAPDDSSPSDEALSSTLAGMTLEEKIGQMLLVGIQGKTAGAEAQKMIAEDKVGGIILYSSNVGSLKELVRLTNDLKKSNSGNPAPLFISIDQEGGKVSRLPAEYAVFPSNAAVGQGDKAAAAGTMGELLAKAVKSSGFNMDFAPCLISTAILRIR